MEAETSKFKVSVRSYAIKYDQQSDLKHNGYIASELKWTSKFDRWSQTR